MKKNNSFNYKHFILLIVFVFTLIIVPFILDYCDISSFINLSTHYDWLAYFGAIFGGLMTLFGVLFTIKNEDKKRIEEMSITYKPIIQPIVADIRNAEGYNIDFWVKQKNINYKVNTSFIELFFKNKGRGEAVNLTINKVNIINNKNGLLFDVDDSFNAKGVMEIITDGYLMIYINLPRKIYTTRKKKINDRFSIEILMEYSDMFRCYTYKKGFLVDISIFESRIDDKKIDINGKKYYCHHVYYKDDPIIKTSN